jgi:endoglucanase
MRRPSNVRRLPILLCVGSLLLATAPVASAAPAPPPTAAFVRINQVGYPAALPKRAYLMSSVAETGATFSVVDAATDAVVLSAAVPASSGAWSQDFGYVYPLDLSAVQTAGRYRIAVAGPAETTSPRFRIGGDGPLYRTALANALSYYGNARDGIDYIPSALRAAPAHLHDQHAMTYLTPHANSTGHFKGDLSPLGVRIDAAGGWFDAGDYLKAVQTESYTTDLLLAGVRDFPSRMGSASSTSDFTAEARFGVEWLLKMWDDSTSTLYYQVGIGNGNAKTVSDHDIWRLPQDDDAYGGTDPRFRYIRHRPVFRAAPPGSLVSPNLAGRDAAAFAMCFQVFHVSAPALAKRCLLAAEHIYDLADTDPAGNLLTLIPFSFYPESEWRDDLELGATELAMALAGGGLPAGLPHTDPSFYLGQAAHWANAYITGPSDGTDTLNLYDVSGFAHYDLYRAIQAANDPAGLEVTRAALLADLKKQLDTAIAQAATDPFGFGFPWATWDTTSHGAGLSVMASEYDALTDSGAYGANAIGWLGNILGANAWGSSLIVGDGADFPDCIHHQIANIAGHLDGTSPVLAGAAVEGPNGTTYSGSLTGMNACPPDGSDRFGAFDGSGAKFTDNVESFSTVEPAIDLTAASPLAFAWLSDQATGGGSGPPPTTTVVTIGFDDGYADQMGTLDLLRAYHMHATFFVNTAFLGDAGRLTWVDLHTLADAGNEIAGHTLHHANVKKLKEPDARLEICGDRVNLFDNGFSPTSFAYPFGSFDAGTEAIVAACGYNSGRGVSGVDDTKNYAETIPPLDAYGTRTPPNPKQGTTVATIEGYVTAAADHGGGWVQLVFHHLCDSCDAYSITPAHFAELLDWLQSQEPNGVVIETTDQVIGGPVDPPVQP